MPKPTAPVAPNGQAPGAPVAPSGVAPGAAVAAPNGPAPEAHVAPTVPPTAAVTQRPFPTPTLEPAVECQFGDTTVSVPIDPWPVGITPGVVPTQFQGKPGLTTFAASEPIPGVMLELRLPRTTFVAGAVVEPEIQVRNANATEVAVSDSVWVVPDGADEPSPSTQTDTRSFPNFIHGPFGFRTISVPGGQTWALPASTVQLPFEATQPVHLHATTWLSTSAPTNGATPGQAFVADVPLHLMAPTPAEELRIELHADTRQWCLRAKDASGGPAVGPLFVRMMARSSGAYMDGGVGGGTGNVWAMRWRPADFAGGALTDLTVWVGGPNYVTARTQVSTSVGP